MTHFQLFSVLVTVISALCSQQPQSSQPPRESQVAAREMFSELVNEQLSPPEDPWVSPETTREQRETALRRNAMIRRNPAAFVPLIQEALAVPKLQETKVPTTPEGRRTDGSEEYQRFCASEAVACTILALLPAEIRDPILKESFDKTVTAAKPVADASLAEHAKWKAAGARPEDRLPVEIALRRSAMFTGRCRELVRAATAARSDVFIEPVFLWIAKGDQTISLRDHGIKYLEQFPSRREEFVRRLSETLTKNKELERDRRLEIEWAIQRLDTPNKSVPGESGKS